MKYKKYRYEKEGQYTVPLTIPVIIPDRGYRSEGYRSGVKPSVHLLEIGQLLFKKKRYSVIP